MLKNCGADQHHFAGSRSLPRISAGNANAQTGRKSRSPGLSGEIQWVSMRSAQAEMMNRNGDAKNDQDLWNANLSLL